MSVTSRIFDFIVDDSKKSDLLHRNGTFCDFDMENASIAVIQNDNCPNRYCYPEISEILINMSIKDTGIAPRIIEYETVEKFQYDQLYSRDNTSIKANILFGYEVLPITNLDNKNEQNISVNIYADHKDTKYLLLLRAIFQRISNESDSRVVIEKFAKEELSIFSDIPKSIKYKSFLYEIGLIVMMITFVLSSVDDLKHYKRDYLVTCGLRIWIYWLAAFVVDYIIFIVPAFLIFLIHYFIDTYEYQLSPGLCLGLPVFLFGIPSILYAYIFGWISSNKILAVLVYISFCAIAIFCYIMDQTSEETPYICGMFYTSLIVYLNGLYGSKVAKWPLFVIPIVHSLLAITILALIEIVRKKWRRNEKELSDALRANFMEEKDKKHRLQDGIAMEESVMNSDSSEYYIRIKNVCKYFRNKLNYNYAVNQVSLGIKEGTIFGLLGTNGAGKTTLMSIILKENYMNSGSIELLGHDIFDELHSQTIGYCPQFPNQLSDDLTVSETMEFFGIFFGKPKSERERLSEMLLSSLNIREFSNRTVGTLSSVVKQLLNIAIPFISEAKVLILDEPSSGVDPISRRKIHHLIQMFKGVKTVILCTHIIDEAETLCDNIAIMIDGCIYSVGSPQYYINKYGRDWKIDVSFQNASLDKIAQINSKILSSIPTAKVIIARDSSTVFPVPAKDIKISQIFKILQELKNRKIGIDNYLCSSTSLEKVFMDIVATKEEEKNSQSDNDNDLYNI